MATPTKLAATRAADRLSKALIGIATQGLLRHHCSDPELGHLWLSEHEHERAVAAKLCTGCPSSNGVLERHSRSSGAVWRLGVGRLIVPLIARSWATPR